ncbi:MAG: site-specific integrase [Limisphaerales bacterium]
MNLLCNTSSEVFYARFRLGGKLRWRSLETKVLSTAKLRLADVLQAERELQAAGDGQITFAQAAQIYRARVAANPELKEKTRIDHEQRFARLMKVITGSGGQAGALPGVRRADRAAVQAAARQRREQDWAAWGRLKLRDVTVQQCVDWAGKLRRKHAGGTTFNKSLSCLQAILDIGIERGARFDNPARSKIPAGRIRRAAETLRELQLPSADQFGLFLAALANSGSGWSRPCADLVRFLAFTGLRLGEARFVTWADCDFRRGQITVRGNPVTGLKRRRPGERRTVPLIADARELLQRLRAERAGEAATQPVMQVAECQRAMDRAAQAVGMARITHHDLRHLFATRCIESGVDIPTVSRWLGHQDGGALAMRVYGHLRDQHSQAMAGKVKF